MRVWTLLLAAALFGSTAPTSATDVQAHAVRDKREVAISRPERVAAKLIAIAESSSYNSTAYAVMDDTWAGIVASDSFVHVVFLNPREVRLKDRSNRGIEKRMVQEILLPLPMDRDPPHIYMKMGKETVSVQLRVPRYDFLLNQPSKR